MKNPIKKHILPGLVLAFSFVFITGCRSEEEVISDTGTIQHGQDTEKTQSDPVTFPVYEDDEFHSVCIDMEADEFNSYGFEYGDSCNLEFSNGKKLEGIPYYNGYYGRTNEPVIVAYPNISHIDIAYCSGDHMWQKMECNDGDTLNISVDEKGKFLNVQNAMSMVYSNDRADFADDAVFANFRAMSGGDMLPDTFYRGVSPFNNTMNRAGTANDLISDNGIRFILNLADSDEKINGYFESEGFASEYAKKLYEEGNVSPLSLSPSYRSDMFMTSLINGLREMMDSEGPYYIHCLEGKDRTGFVCMLLEALSGASAREMEQDYMITYANYYGVTKESDPEKYDTIVDVKFLDMLDWLGIMSENSGGRADDYKEGARQYLLEAGMTVQEVDELTLLLTQ